MGLVSGVFALEFVVQFSGKVCQAEIESKEKSEESTPGEKRKGKKEKKREGGGRSSHRFSSYMDALFLMSSS